MEDFFRINLITMIPIGFWPLPNKRRSEFLKRLNGFTSIFFCNLLAMVELWAAIDQFNNIILLIEAIVTASTAYITILKTIIFMKDRVFTREITDIILDLIENTPVPNDDKAVIQSTEFWKKRVHSVTKFLLGLYFSPYFLYMTIPWLKYFAYNIKECPFPSKFRFDISIMRNFLIAYCFEFGTSQMVIWVFVATEAFFAGIVMFICSRLEILKYSIDTATKQATEKWRSTPLFGKSIKYHTNILRLSEMLETLYSPCLLFQFFFSLLTICMLCFLTTQDNVTKEKQLTFISFFVSMLVQLFIYCYFGQLLQNKFEELCDDTFHSEWYDTPVAYQKDVLFLVARCGKPVILTAYKIMPVNLESFFSILKSSMSYLTLLQSMDSEE